MITPALVILMMIIGWGSAACAMLWGMLRIARYHHKPNPEQRRGQQPLATNARQDLNISLSA